jgi:dihydropteroate synthase
MNMPPGGAISPILPNPFINLGERSFDLGERVLVVGIVNRTPDSFYDRGRTFELEAAVRRASTCIEEGADWIDVGGVPFGPGEYVSPEEEIDRVLPVVRAIRNMSDVVISVDTTSSIVAQAAVEGGADAINDTSGLFDPEMALTVAKHQAGLVIVHSSSPPRIAVARPTYADVVADVKLMLMDRVQRAERAGVSPDKIIIEPGHDLNKNTHHSLEITRRLGEITTLGYPVLVAVSNKDFVGETLGVSVEQRLVGSIAVAVVCVMRGARILRVHNVAETVSAVRTVEAIMGWITPEGLRHNMGEPPS